MMMSPGTYLRKRREATGLSIDTVARQVSSAPRLAEWDLRAWIDRIEQDIAAITDDVILSLSRVYSFDADVLRQLIDIRSFGEEGLYLPQICLLCACTEKDACIDSATGAGCAWSETDPDDHGQKWPGTICTACVDRWKTRERAEQAENRKYRTPAEIVASAVEEATDTPAATVSPDKLLRRVVSIDDEIELNTLACDLHDQVGIDVSNEEIRGCVTVDDLIQLTSQKVDALAS